VKSTRLHNAGGYRLAQASTGANLLDGLVRTAFPNDGKLLAAWESACKVVVTHPEQDQADTPPVPGRPDRSAEERGAGGA
jgi:hypothetical protein